VPRQQLKKLGLNITYQEGLPETYGNAPGEPSLIILHGLLQQVYSKDVCDLFTKGSHHVILAFYFSRRTYFSKGTNCRDISLKAKYLVLLKKVRDKNQFTFLARQSYPEHSQSLYDSYRNATLCPHGYFILDFAQDTDDRLRFRTNVFRDEQPPNVYAPINDEMHRSKFHRLNALKDARPKLRRAIIANIDKELLNSISECTLNVLKGTVKLSVCKKRKLRKFKRQLRTVVDKRVPLAI